jgi:ribonuclease HI
MKKVNIYTDGGCSNNQSKENFGGWGAILEFNGQERELYGSQKNTTNNRMEMTALIEALEALKEKDLEIDIYSDSSYLVECFNKGWYKKWQKNQWMTAGKKPVENQDLWKRLIRDVESLGKVSFHRVKGHLKKDSESEMKKWFEKYNEYNPPVSYARFKEISGYNHRVDALANRGIDEIKGQ